MAFIELKNVWKRFGDQVILERLNLNIEQGEFCVVVGASGCGKTTFLRMLLGEEQPSRGHLLMDGKPWQPEPNAERGIVFQRYSVFPHLTVLDNVLFGLEAKHTPFAGRLFGRARHESLQRARGWLSAVGLNDAQHRFPAELSGGMQQRLALAQTLSSDPRLLLLDEPFGALDPGIRRDMHKLLRELWQTHGITVVMITHDIKEAFTLGTRLLVFDKLRHDPHAPDAYGSRITYDLPVNGQRRADFTAIQSVVKAA